METVKVSIHALLAECDPWERKCMARIIAFQSTHSLRSATYVEEWEAPGYDVSIHALLAECDAATTKPNNKPNRVSIHALLAECDWWPGTLYTLVRGFNPRTPCGVRQRQYDCCFIIVKFQSTHSLRSATMLKSSCTHIWTVSIHALLAECDIVVLFDYLNAHGFNPRTPCGVRLVSDYWMS